MSKFTPIVKSPTSAHTRRLGYNAVVGICIPQGSPRFKEELICTLSDVVVADYVYERGDGDNEMVLTHPMIRWDYHQHPEHLWPEEDYREDGKDHCNAGHIVAIYDYGTPLYKYRNYYAKLADQGIVFEKHKQRIYGKTYRYRPYLGHSAYNHPDVHWSVNRSTTKGVYNGHIFQLAKAIVSRRPMLNIPYEMDFDIFHRSFIESNRPGYVGRYSSPVPPHLGWSESDNFRCRVNIKAFTKWILRNYRSFLLSEKQYVIQQKEKCLNEELQQEEEYLESAFESDY